MFFNRIFDMSCKIESEMKKKKATWELHLLSADFGTI